MAYCNIGAPSTCLMCDFESRHPVRQTTLAMQRRCACSARQYRDAVLVGQRDSLEQAELAQLPFLVGFKYVGSSQQDSLF